MAILKCKMCGGDIELSADKTIGMCDSCGTTMTFPKVDDEQRANMFNRGNQFRRMGEFDKALAVYERIVQEDENDAEAHWCCALCRFGIEYVEDPNTFEYLPTCHRASFDSFLEDVDYLAALEHSDGITKRQYQKDAAKIAEVQRGILATSQNEEPFDVFICYKESENDGTRTRDSLMAQEIYYQLTEQGRRVFFSRITLEDKAGTEYEPYIFAALNSAKVMIVVTTSAEHVNAVWVKNEWSRFLSLMRKDRSKLLLPCYRDMDPYDLPEALSVLQSYDMGKIGFIQDLTRGVNKVLDAGKTKETLKETIIVQQQSQSNTVPLLERAFIFLEDGNWESANEYCEKVLDQDPKNAEAYLGKLMAEMKVRTRDGLKDVPQPFDDSNNYRKAFRFGDEKLKAELPAAVAFIKERNETARKNGIYNKAVGAMNAASTESAFKQAAEIFQTIPGFKDADELKERCLDQAEICRKEAIYQHALSVMQNQREQTYRDAEAIFRSIAGYKNADTLAERCVEQAETCRKDAIYQSAQKQMTGIKVPRYESAIKTFQTIPGWRDADEQIRKCQRRIEEIQAKEETDRKEAERKAEEVRIAAAKKKKRVRITWTVILSTLAVSAAAVALFFFVIRPNQRYNEAKALYDAGKYEDAIYAFSAMDGFRDSAEQIEKCKTAIKDRSYDAALALYNAGKYEEAIPAFEAMGGYRDSDEQIENCKTAIYSAAAAFMEAGEYEKAIVTFETLNGYKDSAAQIEKCTTAIVDEKYAAAVELYTAGKYEDAIAAFTALDGYKDSAEQIKKCETAIKDEKYAAAVELYTAGKYEDAIAAFTALDGYKDSAVQIEKCETAIKDEKYAAAVELYTAERYSDAIAAFTALDGYKDSAAQIEKCETAIYDMIYADAVEFYTAGKYEDAIAAFTALDGYKDSTEKIDEIKCSDKWKKVCPVGETFYFGLYEQDNNTANGKENIEWIVLANEGNKVLVISKYALDCQKYNSTCTDVTWETCSLRKWLNGTFMNAAFSSEEQNCIISSTVTADKNPSYSTWAGNSTTDKVFLLSITEVNKYCSSGNRYFSPGEAMMCAPTDYAIAQGAVTSSSYSIRGRATCWWWLRSPGDYFLRAADVYNDGSVNLDGDNVDVGHAVRPALWIDLGGD